MNGIRTSAPRRPIDDQILAYARRFQAANNGLSPSCAEIAVGVGRNATSKGIISVRLGHMEQQGRIRRGGFRDITILEAAGQPDIAAQLARFTSQQLIEELARRDTDPAWAGVAVCDLCDRGAEDPVIRACTQSDCPIKVKGAA